METYEEQFGCSSILIDTYLDLLSQLFGIKAHQRREHILKITMGVVIQYPTSLQEIVNHLDATIRVDHVLNISSLLGPWNDYIEMVGKIAQRGGCRP